MFKICFSSMILNFGGFVRGPGLEPTHLDLEKLFLLSVSKENLDFKRKHEKILPYEILQIFDFCSFVGFS